MQATNILSFWFNELSPQQHFAKDAALDAAAQGEMAVWRTNKDPFLALIGSGNRRNSTDQIMRMTRGDDRSP